MYFISEVTFVRIILDSHVLWAKSSPFTQMNVKKSKAEVSGNKCMFFRLSDHLDFCNNKSFLLLILLCLPLIFFEMWIKNHWSYSASLFTIYFDFLLILKWKESLSMNLVLFPKHWLSYSLWIKSVTWFLLLYISKCTNVFNVWTQS